LPTTVFDALGSRAPANTDVKLVLVKPDRSYVDEVVFRGGIAGKTFLDVGSDDGRLCFEAMRRGAKRALGIDLDAANVANARAIAARTGVDAEFLQADFEHWRPRETFDVVHLGALDDLFDPIHALRRLAALAGEKVVLDISVRPGSGRQVRRFGLKSPRADKHESTISLRVGPRRTDGKRAFLFTPEAIAVLLNEHSFAFEPISVSPSPFDHRVVIEARRRRIGRLTVVAGPVAVGKSRLISKLAEDDLLRAKVGIPEVTPPLIASSLWKKLPMGPIDHAVLHYNILRPLDTTVRTYERDPVISLFRCAETITFLTIGTTRERICSQLDRRIAKRQPHNPLGPKNRFYRELRALYEDDTFLEGWYNRWLRVVARFKGVTIGNYIVRPDGDDYLVSPDGVMPLSRAEPERVACSSDSVELASA
jgi:hypothetical protein